MNLSISNIAWTADNDESMYAFLREQGFNGLEIAPTRIFPEQPYNHLSEAHDYAQRLKEMYGLSIPSMQSIWYGRQEKVFGSQEERKALIDYTRKACEFAKAIECRNLVFGNPRNRDTSGIDSFLVEPTAIDFFKALGDIALENETVISLEPNPTIYNTNFLNYTSEAVEMIRKIDSRGIMLNVDLGTIIQNEENIDYLESVKDCINHIHISEPYLRPIDTSKEDKHRYLVELSRKLNGKFLSIEMGKVDDLQRVKDIVTYVKSLTE